MADLVQTAANVVKVGSATVLTSQPAGVAITAGNSVYKNTLGDGRWYPALMNGNASQAGLYGLGVSLISAPGIDQPLSIFINGTINLGATLSVGSNYGLSNNAGRIAVTTDQGTNSYGSLLGQASSAANMVSPPSGCWYTGILRA